jgi:hypothetical protein
MVSPGKGWSMQWIRPVSLGLVLSFAACGDAPQPDLPDLHPTNAWYVDSVPFFDAHRNQAPGDEIEYALSATRLANGNFVIADAYAANLVFLDSIGRTIRRVGRRGGGPGEFRVPYWVSQCKADSLFVFDYLSRAITVTDTSGATSRTFRPPGNPHALRCSFAGGVIAAQDIPSEFIGPGVDGGSMSADVWIGTADGELKVAVGELPYGENRTLGKLTQLAVSDSHLFVGTADSAWIDVYSLEGRWSRALPLGVERRSPTRANHERAVERIVSVVSNPARREQGRQLYAEMAMPNTVPPHREMAVDPQGLLWVVVSPLGDPQTRILALDPEAGVPWEVSVPEDLTLFEVGNDYILGSFEDASGFQHVVAYRLHRDP